MTNIDRHFQERISAHYRSVERLYQEGVRPGGRKPIRKIGQLIGPNVLLGTPRGQRIQGIRAIGDFFEGMRRQGKVGLTFRLKRFWILPTANPVKAANSKRRMVPVKHTCYYIMEFRLKGSVLTGALTGTALHLAGCPIKP